MKSNRFVRVIPAGILAVAIAMGFSGCSRNSETGGGDEYYKAPVQSSGDSAATSNDSAKPAATNSVR